MPKVKVGNKVQHFGYDAEGMAAAEKAKMKMKKKKKSRGK